MDDFVNRREINVTENSLANRKFYSKNELEKHRIVSWKEGPQTISKIAKAFSHPNFPCAILDLGQGQRVEIKNLPRASDN